jgi:DNA-binding response OmpR family regulator
MSPIYGRDDRYFVLNYSFWSIPSSCFALCHGPLEVDTTTGTATINGAPVELTRLQYRMLLHLMDNRGRPASRDELRREVLGYRGRGGASSVKFCIHELRGRLGEAGKLIRWKWRQGWYLAYEANGDSEQP